MVYWQIEEDLFYVIFVLFGFWMSTVSHDTSGKYCICEATVGGARQPLVVLSIAKHENCSSMADNTIAQGMESSFFFLCKIYHFEYILYNLLWQTPRSTSIKTGNIYLHNINNYEIL